VGEQDGEARFGALVKLPALKSTLAERILDEPTTQHILALDPDRRRTELR
jgi:hypothetical protein